MLARLLWVLLPLGVALLGVLEIRRRGGGHNAKRRFALEFYDRLGRYVQSKGQDNESYVWLVRHSRQAQDQVGPEGVFAFYRPPAAGYCIHDYEVIVNLLPELHHELAAGYLSSGELSSQYASILHDTLVRHFGALDQEQDKLMKLARSPLQWLREGSLAFLGIPIALLGWVGLLSAGTARRARDSMSARVLSGLMTLVMLLSAIIGIVVGWRPFVQYLSGILK